MFQENENCVGKTDGFRFGYSDEELLNRDERHVKREERRLQRFLGSKEKNGERVLKEECQDFIEDIIEECKRQISAYEGIKNASMRVRRAVLGEIKERQEGGLYYTKPFRELMNCLLDVQDFLGGTLQSENAKSPDYFYYYYSF